MRMIIDGRAGTIEGIRSSALGQSRHGELDLRLWLASGAVFVVFVVSVVAAAFWVDGEAEAWLTRIGGPALLSAATVAFHNFELRRALRDARSASWMRTPKLPRTEWMLLAALGDDLPVVVRQIVVRDSENPLAWRQGLEQLRSQGLVAVDDTGAVSVTSAGAWFDHFERFNSQLGIDELVFTRVEADSPNIEELLDEILGPLEPVGSQQVG
jgi:hypothetical protein